jgi:ATP-dependent exoDNAse (exonuclease V) alpha subunit
MTAHRAQGATLHGRVILDVRSAFAPAIVYVMLSRATTRDHLYILGGLTPDDFAAVHTAPIAGGPDQQHAPPAAMAAV